MPIYEVTECLAYQVEADSEEEACRRVEQNENRNDWLIGVADRHAVNMEDL